MFFTFNSTKLKGLSEYSEAYREHIGMAQEHDDQSEFGIGLRGSGDDSFDFRDHQGQEIASYASELAKFAHENKFEAVMFIDNSSRGAAVAFRTAWEILFPKDKVPTLKSINPYFFLSKDYIQKLQKKYGNDHRVTQRAAARMIDKLNPVKRYKDNLFSLMDNSPLSFDISGFEKPRTKELQEFWAQSGLKRNSKVLIIDSCSHYDMTFYAIQHALAKARIRNVKFAALTNHNSDFALVDKYVCDYQAESSSCVPIPTVARLILHKGNDITSDQRNNEGRTSALNIWGGDLGEILHKANNKCNDAVETAVRNKLS